jgi:hypothetical protein
MPLLPISFGMIETHFLHRRSSYPRLHLEQTCHTSSTNGPRYGALLTLLCVI